MTTMPVVWCTDPNSVNNKPTAFALHGIQLQGNVTEKQVLVLRELVNAAAEGRLILPSDGTFMLLGSNLSLGSSIVPENLLSKDSQSDSSNIKNVRSNLEPPTGIPVQNKENVNNTYILMPVNNIIAQSNPTASQSASEEVTSVPNTDVLSTNCSDNSNPPKLELEPKYSTFVPPDENNLEFLYEFLCCAKCMNETSKCSNSVTKNNSSILKRYLETRIAAFKGNDEKDPVYRIAKKGIKKSTSCSKLRRNIFPVKRSKHTRIAKTNQNLEDHKLPGGEIPVYAQVKKHVKSESLDDGVNSTVPCKKESAPNETSAKFCDKSTNTNNSGDSHSFDNLKVKDVATVAGVSENSRSFIQNKIDAATNCTAFQNENNLLDTTATSPGSNSSSRKTSFDSTCTISSMDSGFIEMQNKVEYLPLANMYEKTFDNITDKNESQSCDITGKADNGNILKEESNLLCDNNSDCDFKGEKIARLNLKECLTQSRNRRKSYEEFKALFLSPGSKEMKNDDKLKAKNLQDMRMTYGFEGKSPLEAISEQVKENFSSQTKTSDVSNENENTISSSRSDPNQTTTSNLKNESVRRISSAGEVFANMSKSNENRLFHSQSNSALNQISKYEKEKAKFRRKSYEEFKRLVRDCELPLKRQNSIKQIPKITLSSYESSSIKESDILNSETASNKVSTLKAICHSFARSSSKFELRAIEGDQLNQSTPTTQQTDSKQKGETYKRNFKIYDKLISYGTIYDIIQRKNDIYNMTYQKYDKYMTYGTIYEILHRKACQSDIFQRKRALSDKFRKSFSKKGLTGSSSKYSSFKYNGTIYDIIQKNQHSSESSYTDRSSDKNKQVCKYGAIYDIIQSEKYDLLMNGSSGQDKKNRFTVSKIDEKIENLSLNSTNDSHNGEKSEQKSQQIGGEQHLFPKAIKPKKIRRFSNILSYTSHKSSSVNTTTEIDGAVKSKDLHGNFSEQLCSVQVQTKGNPVADETYSRISKSQSQTGQIFKSNSLNAISSASLTETETLKVSAAVKKISIDNSDISPLRRYYDGHVRISSPPHPHDSNFKSQMPTSGNVAQLSVPRQFDHIKTSDLCSTLLGNNDRITSNTVVTTTTTTTTTISVAPSSLNVSSSSTSSNTTCNCNVNTTSIINNHHLHHANFCGGSHNSSCANVMPTTDGCNTSANDKKLSPGLLSKKSTSAAKKDKSRRLSEFTRGEFLNEKP